MFVRENQLTPFHYHEQKTEDIINRGGKGAGRLAVQLYNAGDGGKLLETPVTVSAMAFGAQWMQERRCTWDQASPSL